ncbi:hypothetical protein MMC13_000871 [Lambiella insularis]|nr:hypothetical protein [Lambiella insularis]
MAKQHLACFLYGAGDARLEPWHDPVIEEPQDVIIEIGYTGVCGSDVHFWVNGGIGAYMVQNPLIMGHEAAGTVVSVGEGVTTLVPGDRVAIEPGIPCRRCSNCKAGRYHFCGDMQFAASPPTTHGTLTKFFKAPVDFCYKLPDSMSLQEGVLLEPLAVAVHAVRLAQIGPGVNVVVFGAGPVGLLCGAVVKAFGASKVVAVDIVDQRLAFAAKYAASGAYKPETELDAIGNAAKLVHEQGLGDSGVDVVIDASGAAPSIQTGIQVLKMGGTYVQAGMGKSDVDFPIMAMCMKELHVFGCFRYGAGDYDLARKLVGEGKVSVKELITGVVPFEQATQAWETIRRGEGIKVLIEGQK